MSTIRRASVAQMRATSDKLANLADVAKCARMARKAGASMLFLPECFGFIGESSRQTLQNAEPPFDSAHRDGNHSEMRSLLESIVSDEDDASLLEHLRGMNRTDWSLLHGLCAIARASGLWISGAGIHEAGAPPLEEKSRVHNAHVVIDATGSLVSSYRKIHLFDVSIPNVNLRESATTAPGSDLVVCDTPVGRLGVSTCYDLRFPEMYARLVNRGAEIIAVPSAFTVPTGTAHWHVLLRSRAIECQAYVVAAAQYGRHNAKRESYGHSLAVDPWGEILGDAGGCDGNGTEGETPATPSIITFDVDLEKVKTIRERMPIRTHRETASYS